VNYALKRGNRPRSVRGWQSREVLFSALALLCLRGSEGRHIPDVGDDKNLTVIPA
jgi:hypothetical protein